jgi:hypothetical protein
MAEGYDPYKKAEDVGSESPASEEAQQQGRSGDQGAQAGQIGGTGSQPAQASNRRPAEHHQEEERRTHFPPGQAPSEQGEKEHSSPHVIAQHQQGIGRQSGSHGAHSERSEEEAQRGEPAEEHTRSGRQSVPGDRPGNRG